MMETLITIKYMTNMNWTFNQNCQLIISECPNKGEFINSFEIIVDPDGIHKEYRNRINSIIEFVKDGLYQYYLLLTNRDLDEINFNEVISNNNSKGDWSYSENIFSICNLTPKFSQKIFRNFPGMYPFEDDEILECVKFEPHDIGLFSMDKWPLANNSFLLHGYYTYRHLIFAKMKYGDLHKHILGVPGIFRDRERFMAHMFGFRGFKGVRNKPLVTGEFGYWYLEIKL